MTAGRILPVLLPAAVAAAAFVAAGPPGPGGPGLPAAAAAAAAPAAAPVFSAPLDITNPLFPVAPGTVHVYLGKEGRRRVTSVVRHLPETRTFSWDGLDVPCRVVVETKFENGRCTEFSRSHFAQADDGGVYYFGEISIPCGPAVEDGDDEPADTESSGWVVGLRAPDDPPDTAEGAGPFLFMPASPVPGDAWKPEDLFPVVDETDLAVRANVGIRTPAGRFRGCLEVRETSAIDPGSETKWYAPGVGVVRVRARDGGLRLQASTSLRR